MPSHRIGSEFFEFWQSDAPRLAQRHIGSFTRPGVDGVGQQLAGTWGKQFEVIVTAHLPSFNAALAKILTYKNMIGSGFLEVVYHNISFYTNFQTQYTVDDADVVGSPQAGILMGPNYIYTDGGIITARFVLTPYAV